MGLVQHNTIPGVTREECALLSIELLVIGNEDRGAFVTETEHVTRNGPLGGDTGPYLRRGQYLIDDTAAVLKDVGPGIEHGEGREEESVWLRIVDDHGRNLNGLAESHVIALEATMNANGGFAP